MAAIILGFFGSVFGHRFFCLTIYGVENFVKDHYQEQIDKLKNYDFKDLQNLIIELRSEEIEYMQDGLQDNYKFNSFFAKIWIGLVYKGSKKAVNIAKKY